MRDRLLQKVIQIQRNLRKRAIKRREREALAAARKRQTRSKVKVSKLSRTKGHSFEREIAKALRVVYPAARRQLEYNVADANGVDLQETGVYRVQCKRGKRPASLSAILEVKCDEWLGEVPVLVTQGDRGRILVAMPFEEWLRLLKACKNNDLK